MSLKLEGLSCPACHAYLFDEDDVVYCPVCGAPHHRDCYNRIGHCALETLHGTERQYDLIKNEASEKAVESVREKQPQQEADTVNVRCQMCGEQYGQELRGCPKCGAPNVSRMGQGFTGIDFLGGVPADYDIGEGVTAEEAKRFVVANTPRYIPKFASMTAHNKASWNWFAFLLPYAWFLSRKMYKNGIFTAVLMIASSLLTLPLSIAVSNVGITAAKNYSEMIRLFYDSMPQIGTAAIVMASVGLLFSLAVRLFIAIMGDYYYKCYTISGVKQIKSDSEDVDNDYRRKGGINFFAMLLGVMAVQYLPYLIAMFVL